MRRFGLICSMLPGMLFAPPASAAAPEPTPGPGWALGRAEHQCTLVRQDGTSSFLLRSVPGSGVWEVRLVGPTLSPAGLRNVRRLAISLQAAGDNVPGTTYVRQTEAGTALVIYQIPRSFLDRFAGAEGIRVARGGETLLDIPLTGATEAVAAVRQCEDGALREWGVDPVAFAALRSPPVGLPAAVVSDDDYPQTAVRAHQTGTTVVRLMIDVRGRVSDCATVVSSGHAILDTRSCEIFRERLRMTPAVGADGAPTAAPLVTPLRWLLPG